jgi:hypothetical protein
MIYKYGVDEVDPDNYNRLLSAEQQRGIPNGPHVDMFQMTVPESCILLLDSIIYEINVGVSAVNRSAFVQVTNVTGDRIWMAASLPNQPGALNVIYSFTRGVFSSQIIKNITCVSIPNIPILGGNTITVGMLGGDGSETFLCDGFYYRIILLNRP